MPRSFTATIFVLCLALAAFGGWFIGTRSAALADHEPKPLPVLGKAPTYHDLTDQLGEHVNSSEFQGKVQVVTFLFPYCTTFCPLIAAHLVGLENTLVRAHLQDRVELVAFNVDPAGTGPKVMSAFLKEYGWNPTNTRWQYLTGTPSEIRRVVTDGYHIAYKKIVDTDSDEPAGPSTGPDALTPQPEVVNPLAEKAHVDYDVDHNDGLIIVDRQGHIRKIYQEADVVSNDRLLSAITALLPSSSLSGHAVSTN